MLKKLTRALQFTFFWWMLFVGIAAGLATQAALRIAADSPPVSLGGGGGGGF